MFFDAWAAEAEGSGVLHIPPLCRIIINLDYLIVWLESWEGLLLVTDLSTTLRKPSSESSDTFRLLVSWEFRNPGERFDRSIDRVAVGKRVISLAVG